MANHTKKKQNKRIPGGFPGTTEHLARPVIKQIQKTRAKPKPTKQRDTGGKTTAKSPFKAKTAAQSAAAKKSAIAKRDARMKANPVKRKVSKPKAKKRSYGRKMT